MLEGRFESSSQAANDRTNEIILIEKEREIGREREVSTGINIIANENP